MFYASMLVEIFEQGLMVSAVIYHSSTNVEPGRIQSGQIRLYCNNKEPQTLSDTVTKVAFVSLLIFQFLTHITYLKGLLRVSDLYHCHPHKVATTGSIASKGKKWYEASSGF